MRKLFGTDDLTRTDFQDSHNFCLFEVARHLTLVSACFELEGFVALKLTPAEEIVAASGTLRSHHLGDCAVTLLDTIEDA